MEDLLCGVDEVEPSIAGAVEADGAKPVDQHGSGREKPKRCAESPSCERDHDEQQRRKIVGEGIL